MSAERAREAWVSEARPRNGSHRCAFKGAADPGLTALSRALAALQSFCPSERGPFFVQPPTVSLRSTVAGNVSHLPGVRSAQSGAVSCFRLLNPAIRRAPAIVARNRGRSLRNSVMSFSCSNPRRNRPDDHQRQLPGDMERLSRSGFVH
jgi:hypothetical protein